MAYIWVPSKGTMTDQDAKAWQLSAAMYRLQQSFVGGTS